MLTCEFQVCEFMAREFREDFSGLLNISFPIFSGSLTTFG